LKVLTEGKVAEDAAVVAGKLQKLRESDTKSRIYGYGDTVDTGVLTADQIEGYKAEMRDLKKQKQSINDKVLELNVRTEIELDTDTVALLEAEQLV
jgi:peptide subunit release factor 1 (eRF1)